VSAKVLVFNGWAAGRETWDLCTFPHDWIFDYVEQMDGLPERVMSETDEAVLVGFSMGGTTALRMALAHPEKIRGLVLVSATARMMEDRETGWKGMSLRRRAALKLGTQWAYRGDPSPMFREDNMDRGLDYLQQWDLRPQLSILSNPSNFSNLSNLLRIPVRIFQSERDAIVRPSNAMFLKGVFPQAVVTMVPGAEHTLPVTIPEMIDEAVFLITHPVSRSWPLAREVRNLIELPQNKSK